MKACGLVVEYNPFHYGHKYHLEEAKKKSNADCVIAVMSGNFLQRGEPAIIDKYKRAKAALISGVDMVLELPYVYAVQHSDYFAKGAIDILYHAGVDSICFGSESGDIAAFLDAYKLQNKYRIQYNNLMRKQLDTGVSYPDAASKAYHTLFEKKMSLDLSKPNNVLGISYIRAIKDQAYPITPLTIPRVQNDYHDTEITGPVASATSIRKALFDEEPFSDTVHTTMPGTTFDILHQYKQTAGTWHNWELYFPNLKYRVQTMRLTELKQIEGVVEGLEHRIMRTAATAVSFYDWMMALKTKRYTWTRLQRIFVHILTNTCQQDFSFCQSPGYMRILGMNKKGQAYVKQQKKKAEIPFITKLNELTHPYLEIEERATKAYYSILSPHKQRDHFKRELQPPVRIDP